MRRSFILAQAILLVVEIGQHGALGKQQGTQDQPSAPKAATTPQGAAMAGPVSNPWIITTSKRPYKFPLQRETSRDF
jgi:hypothetical protein